MKDLRAAWLNSEKVSLTIPLYQTVPQYVRSDARLPSEGNDRSWQNQSLKLVSICKVQEISEMQRAAPETAGVKQRKNQPKTTYWDADGTASGNLQHAQRRMCLWELPASGPYHAGEAASFTSKLLFEHAVQDCTAMFVNNIRFMPFN